MPDLVKGSGVPLDLQCVDIRERARLCQQIDAVVKARFEEWLPREHRSFYRKHGLFPTAAQDIQRIWDLFDQFIIEKAVDLGPRLYLSDFILYRLTRWSEKDDEGVRKLEQLHDRIVMGAKIRRGIQKAPLDPLFYEARKHVKQELRVLQQRLRAMESTCNRALGWPGIEHILEEHAAAFPRLIQQRTSLKAFANAHPELMNGFASGQTTYSGLINEWIGWATNRDPEKTRQRISEMGSEDS